MSYFEVINSDHFWQVAFGLFLIASPSILWAILDFVEDLEDTLYALFLMALGVGAALLALSGLFIVLDILWPTIF